MNPEPLLYSCLWLKWQVAGGKTFGSAKNFAKRLAELKENITDAYRMMLETESEPAHAGAKTLELGGEV